MDRRSKLWSFYKSKKRMPTFSEMEKLLGYKSKAAVSYFVNKLVKDGTIRKDTRGKLVPKTLGEVKVLGVVEAGFPTSASEELVDTMSLDEYLVDNKEATYLLKVKGDSMKDAGIMPGDLVLVERGKTPKSGDIVVAEVDGEYTLKYYRTRGKRHYLEAANDKYKDIYPSETLTIPAVVKAVLRKY
ncbi:LexA family transcriptional regulator [Candidatus Parcubacteria bacterium]|nr:LexA family transcriptional regulator [Candidatus Parcubacteria bacterium]